MRYIKQLDGLRFIAIFFVLVEHFATFLGNKISAGYYGVDLFFVISGFLITTILLGSKQPFLAAYKKFIGRRTLRIFPIYYLTILVLFILGYEYLHRYLFYCLTYTYNYAWVYFNIPNNAISHFWSLCVEEQFYLVWPFIILGLKNNRLLLKAIVLVLILVCSAQYCFHVFDAITPYNNVGIFPRANSLGIGAFGAILHAENKISKKVLENRWLEFLAILLLLVSLFSNYNLKYLVCPVLSLFFILKTTHQGFSFQGLDHFLKNRWVVYFGSISYGIYLYHLPLEYYMTKYFFNPFIWDKIDFASLGTLKKLQWNSWLIKFPLYSALSIAIAHVSYKYLEKPILSLKDKWF